MRASLFLLPVTAVLLAGFLVMAWLVYGLLLAPSLVIIPLSFSLLVCVGAAIARRPTPRA